VSYLICLNVSGNSDKKGDVAPKKLLTRRSPPDRSPSVRTAAAATATVTRLPPVHGVNPDRKPEPEKKPWKLCDLPGPVVERPPYRPEVRFNPRSNLPDVTSPDVEDTELTEDQLVTRRLLEISDSLDEPIEYYPSFPSVRREEFGPWRTHSDPLPPIVPTPPTDAPLPQPPQAKKKRPPSLRRRLLGSKFADASEYSVSAGDGPERGS